MGRILKPMVRGGGWYPSKKWIPLVKNGGYTTQNGGETEPVWATASGAIASFTTPFAYPLKKLMAQINPVQDLHGQDAPYPAGGGKNKLPLITSSIKALNTTGSWSGNAYTMNGITYAIQEENNTIVGVSVSGTATANSILVLAAEMEVTQGQKLNGSPTNGRMFISNSTGQTDYAVDTGSGGTVNTSATGCRAYIQTLNGTAISGSLLYKPMLRNATETDATFAPYSNICPISGHTGLSVEVRGKNLLDPDLLHGYWDVDNNGVFVASENWRASKKIKCKPSTYYRMSGTTYATGGYSGRATFWDEDGNYLGYAGSNQPFVTLANTAYMAVYTSRATATDAMQIEEGDTASDFTPYTGTTTPVSWQDTAGTVYGGTLDVTTGVLTATMAMVDLGTLNWLASSGAFYSTDLASVIKLPASASVIGNYISSALIQIPSSTTLTPNKYTVAQNGRLWAKDDKSTTPAAFKAAMSGVQLVCELATPQSFTHEGQPVDTLVGQNNVFVDTGDVEVTYRIE